MMVFLAFMVWPASHIGKYILPKFHLQVQNLNGSNLGANSDVVESTYAYAGDLTTLWCTYQTSKQET